VNFLERQIAALFRRAGVELVARWRLPNWSQSRRLSELFGLCGIDCVIDVGANIGQYHDFLRREVGFRGPVHSFEPVGSTAEVLMKRAATDPAWTVQRCALGQQSGQTEINVMKSTGFSSIFRPKPGLFDDKNTIAWSETVPMRRLDSFDITGNLYLKLDTQGSDLEVFSGAAGLLSQVRAMQSELSIIPIYYGTPSWQESLAAYQAAGFALSDFFPVTRDERQRTIEFDCVLVRAT
jgi:FkbM family methyltransferase